MLGCGQFEMALLVAVTGRGPALLGQYDEVWGRDVLRAFDHTMDVVTMCLVLWPAP